MVTINTVRAEPFGDAKAAAVVGHLVVKGPAALLEAVRDVPSVTLSHIDVAKEGPVRLGDGDLAEMREAMGDSVLHVTVVSSMAGAGVLTAEGATDRMAATFASKEVGVTDRAIVWHGATPSLRTGMTAFAMAMRFGDAVTLLPSNWGMQQAVVQGLMAADAGGGVFYAPLCKPSASEWLMQHILYVIMVVVLAVICLLVFVRRDTPQKRVETQQQGLAMWPQ